MYSETITQTSIEKLEAEHAIQLHRYTVDESLELTKTILKVYDDEGRPNRPLRKLEHDFIRNERILFQQDFNYALRYISIILDTGGLGHLELWDSQKVLLRKVAELEERNLAQAAEGIRPDGILIADHKGGRQLGHTAIVRALIWHRLIAYSHTRAATVCVDEPGIHKVYEKDELLYEHIPFFLRPTLKYRTKDAHFGFEPFGSSLTYYQSQQRSGIGTGIGTGATYDISHMTEVATYAYPDMLELDFFPTLPQNPYTMCILETTAFGRANWWRTFSEAVRHGKKPRWSYLFIPFYAEPTKYRRRPPEGWSPNAQTQQVLNQVRDTSTEFMGYVVELEREQLYWWESSYNEAMESNALNKFLSNYAVVPEQSFQHSGYSAFSAQVLDELRMGVEKGLPYEVGV
jgi:hypothetical protein